MNLEFLALDWDGTNSARESIGPIFSSCQS